MRGRSEDTVERATLDENSVPGADYKVGDLVDFAAPGGGRFAGILRELREDSAIFDFNPPLAGEVLHFDVKVVTVRDATEEELEHGHAHTPEMHDH